MATEGRVERIEKEIQKLKEDINSKSEELDIRQRCLKDFQMMAAEKQVRAGHVEDTSQNQDQLRRKSEIFFSRAHWKLTETDGQLGIGQLISECFLTFKFSKTAMQKIDEFLP